MSIWYINKNYSADIQHAFASIDKVFDVPADAIISADSISHIFKHTIDNKVFYIKRYTQSGRRWRKYFFRSCCRSEWENLLFCKKLKINTPQLVAYGEKRGLFNRANYRSILITEEIPNAITLSTAAKRHPTLFKHQEWRWRVIGIIADYVKRLHDRKFIHYDLNWRNIMITDDLYQPKVYFIDIPSGRVKDELLYPHGVKKDLLSLDKLGAVFLSRAERLRFYLLYKTKGTLEKKDKKFIRSFLKYKNKKKLSAKKNG